MNITEMHRAFRIGLDKTTNLSLPDFLPEEIDFWLNSAIRKFVKTRYSGNNPKAEGFEQTQKRTDDLRTLVKRKLIRTSNLYYQADESPISEGGILQPSLTQLSSNNSSFTNSYYAKLPVRSYAVNSVSGVNFIRPYWFALSEEVFVDKYETTSVDNSLLLSGNTNPSQNIYLQRFPYIYYSSTYSVTDAVFTKGSSVVTSASGGFTSFINWINNTCSFPTNIYVMSINDLLYNEDWRSAAATFSSLGDDNTMYLSGNYNGIGGTGIILAMISDPDVYVQKSNLIDLPVADADLNSYIMRMTDPLGEHIMNYDFAKPLRLFRDDVVEIITDGTYYPFYYSITYLAKPMRVNSIEVTITSNTSGEVEEDFVYEVGGASGSVVKYNNSLYNYGERFIGVKDSSSFLNVSGTPTVTSVKVDCDLPEHTHDEIVNMAVDLALENIESQRFQSHLSEIINQE